MGPSNVRSLSWSNYQLKINSDYPNSLILLKTYLFFPCPYFKTFYYKEKKTLFFNFILCIIILFVNTLIFPDEKHFIIYSWKSTLCLSTGGEMFGTGWFLKDRAARHTIQRLCTFTVVCYHSHRYCMIHRHII